MSDCVWQQFDNKIWDNNESLWSMTNFRWKDTGLRMKSKLIYWINDWYAWQQEHFLELIWEVLFFRTKKYIPAVNFCKTVNYAKISWIKIINQSQVWRKYRSSLENCADSICVINRQSFTALDWSSSQIPWNARYSRYISIIFFFAFFK